MKNKTIVGRGLVKILSTLLFLAIVALMVTFLVTVLINEWNGIKADESYFGFSPTRTGTGRFLSPLRLGNSEYCGHCHTDIYRQWNASAHHFSSFNNPIYRKIALTVDRKHGRDTLKFCAGCHDPLPLLGGELGDGTEPFNDRGWSANAGLTCLTCHRITAIRGHNGNYTIDPPLLHPFALTEQPILQKLHGLLLDFSPALHRRVLSKPFYASAEYCASCHTLITPKAINGVRDIRLLNEYSDWHASAYAKPAAGHGEKKATDCKGCHMPLVPSSDPAAKNGLVRSHRFAAANTALPTFNRDFEQLQAIDAFLGNGKLELDIVDIRHSGNSLAFTVQVSNRGVGHSFPAGTTDANQAWLQIGATDAGGRQLFSSGELDARGEIAAGAETFGVVYADRRGLFTDRLTTTTEAVTLVDKRLIEAGGKVRVDYSFELPPGARMPITIEARLNWRKYSPAFLRWVFDGRKTPEPPVTVLGEVKK